MTFEELRQSVAPLLAAIPGASPAGVPGASEPDGEWLQNEVAKLQSPAGLAVNWKEVEKRAGGLLQNRYKDLEVGTYLAHALHQNAGLAGLARGSALVAQLMADYWDTMQPDLKRVRRRGAAVQWFVERSKVKLELLAVAAEAQDVESLAAAVEQLASVTRDKLQASAPAMSPLLELVEKLRQSLPPPEPPPSAAPPEPAPAPVQAQSAPAPVVQTDALAGTSVDAADPTPALAKVGKVLVQAASAIRATDAASPLSARLLRVGLWLHVNEPSANGGRTSLPAPPEATRSRLKAMADNRQWAALLDEVETVVNNHCFWLDPHRLAVQAHAGLGPSHDAAQRIIGAEIRSALSRMPRLPELAFSDGTPLADPMTRTWIADLVRPAGKGGSEGGAPDRTAEATALLAAGDVRGGLAILRAAADGARGGRARFQAELELARSCTSAGLSGLAKSLLEELDRSSLQHGLDEWEPNLAAECLSALILASRSLGDDPKAQARDLAEPYARLCRLDPMAAHEMGPSTTK